MRTLSRIAFASIALGALALAPSTARAESNRDPGYVHGQLLGLSVVTGGGGAAFPLEVGGGYHVMTGKSEGLSLGLAQRFTFSSGTFFHTLARVGWTIPLDISGMELGIAPYATGGIAYGSGAGDVRAAFGFGAEGRFFPLKEGAGRGFFATGRPIDLSFIPIGSGAGTTVIYTFNFGAGYAF